MSHHDAPAPDSPAKSSRLRGGLRAGAAIVLLAAYTAAALIFLVPSRSAESSTTAAAPAAAQPLAMPLILRPGALDSVPGGDASLLHHALFAPVDTLAAMASAPAPVAAPAPAVDSAALEHDVISRFAHGPLAKVLRRRTRRSSTADSIASALVHEAKRLEVAPSLLAAILITENPELDSAAVSSQGATGLMQVMPFHAGEYDCSSDDLIGIRSNICHGARVLGTYLKRSKDVRTALLRYNGCVRGTNTPRCHRYPDKVMRLASKMRRQLLLNAAADRRTALAPGPVDTVAMGPAALGGT